MRVVRGRKGVRNRFGKNSFSVPDTFSCSRHSWSQAQGPGATLAELETGVSVKQMIERVPLGARVPALNPLRWDYDSTFAEPEESSWAKLTLVMRKRDGGVVDAELLRPRAWIEAAGIAVGKPLPLNLPELNIRDEVSVTAIEDCPPIASGAGSVVTARFVTREAHLVASVQLRGPGGEFETLTGTELHPIWSVDRADWIPLSQLQPGERLLCSDASTSWDGESERGQAHAIVLGVTLSTVCEPVYNLEVHGEHVYQVGELGVLVHNAGADNYEVGRNAPEIVRNWRGEPVQIPKGHIMSPRDPAMSVPPIIESGPFTTAQREAMLRGASGGTRLSPHHRHQIPTTKGGVIDELPGPGHPSGNIHTGGSPSRHPSSSIFNSIEGGKALRLSEIFNHWVAKGRRLIEVEPGVWVDPGF